MKRLKGFTLVELVITIAIVIVLSMVSVPIYRNYVDKAITAEGYALLGMILAAQKAYYSENGYFYQNFNQLGSGGHYTADDNFFGIDARGNKYFTLFRIGDMWAVDHQKFETDCVAYMPNEIAGKHSSCLALYYNISTGVRFYERNN